MPFQLEAPLVAVVLFVGTLGFLEIGRRLGVAQKRTGRGREGTGPIDAAVFGLLGLLIAFTFSGAADRFQTRRELIVREANAIGTAYLRLDLLPDDVRDRTRQALRRYLDSRLALSGLFDEPDQARAESMRAAGIQAEIWAEAVRATRDTSPAVTSLVLASLNESFDVATSRIAALQLHPPLVIFEMLCGLALVSATFAGYAMSSPRALPGLHTIGYALVIAATVYVILDLEFPRLGLIRVDAADQVLIDLRQSMDAVARETP